MRVCLVAAIVIASVAVAAAQPHDKKRADKLFEDGRRYLATKEYALACTAFEQSQEADPAIGTQLNIAKCYEDWGHLAAAYRAYLEGEKMATPKHDVRLKSIQTKIAQLAPIVPHLQLVVPADADPAAIFVFDGKEIDRAHLAEEMLVELGAHTIEARVPGKPPRLATIDLKLAEHKRVPIEVPKPEVKVVVTTPPRKRWKFIGGLSAAGAGVVTIGFASYVSLVARQDYQDAVKDCPGTICTNQEAYDVTQRARRRANYMSLVTGVGAIAVGVGVYLVLTSRDTRSEPRVTIAPSVSPDGIGLAIGGRL